MRNVFIIVVLMLLVFLFSIMMKRNHHVRQRGTCLYVRSQMLKERTTPPSYVPQCTLSGNYFSQQCDSMTQRCWCVRPGGKKISGTEAKKGEQPSACHLNWMVRWFQRAQI